MPPDPTEEQAAARVHQDLPPDMARFLAHVVCVQAVSSNVDGTLTVNADSIQPCKKPTCQTLKTIHTVSLTAHHQMPCNVHGNDLGDGTLKLYNLVTAFYGDGFGRGVHRGHFVWAGPGPGPHSVVYGKVVGMTNVGTHRAPNFPPCQPSCDTQGVMEGQLYDGVFEIFGSPDFRLATLNAAYRLAFTPTFDGGSGSIKGTVEGAVLVDCRDDVP